MNNEKVYLKGYVVGHSADTLGYKGLQIQLENMDIVEVDESLVYRNIDEPQKPVVPQFVADWINYCKKHNFTLLGFLDPVDDFGTLLDEEFEGDTRKCLRWCRKESDKIARAWLDGYKVEQEKRYLVKIVGMDNINGYLSYNKKLKKWFFGIASESRPYRSKHTRKELEEAGFGWVFDCEGIELEEVEE